jgi:hypothetical protein
MLSSDSERMCRSTDARYGDGPVTRLSRWNSRAAGLSIRWLRARGCIIEVRGSKEIPFATEDVASVVVNHKRWNFRDGSDARGKSRAASA